MKNKDKAGYKIAAFLWCISALISFLSAVIDNNANMFVPIGVMNFCIGMMFLSLSQRRVKKIKA
jgi:hypothetical protein